MGKKENETEERKIIRIISRTRRRERRRGKRKNDPEKEESEEGVRPQRAGTASRGQRLHFLRQRFENWPKDPYWKGCQTSPECLPFATPKAVKRPSPRAGYSTPAEGGCC